MEADVAAEKAERQKSIEKEIYEYLRYCFIEKYDELSQEAKDLNKYLFVTSDKGRQFLKSQAMKPEDLSENNFELIKYRFTKASKNNQLTMDKLDDTEAHMLKSLLLYDWSFWFSQGNLKNYPEPIVVPGKFFENTSVATQETSASGVKLF